MNRFVILLVVVLACSFIGATGYCAEPAAKPAKAAVKTIPVTPKKFIHDISNQTVYGKRLMYNGDGSYTLYMKGEGKEWWPLLIDGGQNRFGIVLLEDAPTDSPISVDIGEWSSWSAKWNKPVVIHVHNLDEVGAGGWVHSSGGKNPTRTTYQTNIIE